MQWNEKIDLIKKRYSAEEFSVPHIDRKKILRQIENTFIRRPAHYHHSNEFSGTFSNWFDHLEADYEVTIRQHFFDFLQNILATQELFWLGIEFETTILIYKCNHKVAASLFQSALSKTRTFHIVDKKYKFLLAFRYNSNQTVLRACGDELFIRKLKNILT